MAGFGASIRGLLSKFKESTEMTDITTSSGYMARFWELVAENQHSRSPMRDALRLLEGELFDRHNARRYKNYNSFAATKCKRPRKASFKTV